MAWSQVTATIGPSDHEGFLAVEPTEKRDADAMATVQMMSEAGSLAHGARVIYRRLMNAKISALITSA